ncbi:endonuclease NucS domain-containing protein [Burkholderia gladioli]|uniref:endonuclease NucS domain-containing protein n=1 Tax=Burkholderia gladioli TaxID=28095 RepID=UPI0016400017|nr:endonuclease NucS domain-containing protein [Burkholderia gladioli]
MSRQFLVVQAKPGGGVELFPMREWCLNHPDETPAGLNIKQVNSHRVRDELRRIGWKVEESDTQVLMFPPGFVDDGRVQEMLGTGDALDNDEDIRETAFELEAQLQDFIAYNIQSVPINGKRLTLYVDPTSGSKGIEFQTPVGRIDVLATDADGGFVVFELKRGRAPDQAIGQLARYMGWLKKTIARDREVHGVIVARGINETLRYSVAAVPNVSLYEYKVRFDLFKIPEATE